MKNLILLLLVMTTGCIGGGKAQVLKEQLIKDAKLDVVSSTEDAAKIGTDFIRLKFVNSLEDLDKHFATLIKVGYDTGSLSPDNVAKIVEQYYIERKKLEDLVELDTRNLLVLIDKIDSTRRVLDVLIEMERYKEEKEKETVDFLSEEGKVVFDSVLGENIDPRISFQLEKIWSVVDE